MPEENKNNVQKKKTHLTPSEVSVFCTQTALILKAGIPLYEGIEDAYAEMEDSAVKSALDSVNESLTAGMPLSMAMQSCGAFDDYMVHMAEIGETSGTLEEVLTGLAEYYMRQKQTKDRIRSAVVYPVMLFVMLSAVVTLLITKILPVFQDIFKQLGGDVTGTASHMLDLGIAAGGIAVGLIILILIAILLLYFITRTEKGRQAGQKFFITFPFTKKLAIKMASHKFASAMKLMLASGVNTEEALRLTKSIIQNKFIEDKIDVCTDMMMDGMSFSEAVKGIQIFPSLFIRMLSVGVRTGSVSEVMEKLTDIYEDEIETTLGNMTAFIEPCLVGILAVIIGAILVSVMLPLVGVMSSIG